MTLQRLVSIGFVVVTCLPAAFGQNPGQTLPFNTNPSFSYCSTTGNNSPDTVYLFGPNSNNCSYLDTHYYNGSNGDVFTCVSPPPTNYPCMQETYCVGTCDGTEYKITTCPAPSIQINLLCNDPVLPIETQTQTSAPKECTPC
jgi:hypothetical protein